MYREVTRNALIIDPFAVPKRFEEAGLSSEVVAARIAEALRHLEAATHTKMRKDNLALLQDEALTPDAEIPGTKLGIKTTVEILRAIFAIYPQHVSGSIIAPFSAENGPLSANQQVTVTIYITTGRKRRQVAPLTLAADNIRLLPKQAALIILGEVNPYVRAAYEQDNGHWEAALAIVEQLIDDPSETSNYRKAAYNNLEGNILESQHMHGEAIAKYQKATELDPKNPIAYYNWGNVLKEQNLYSEAIAKYQKATELDSAYAIAYYNWGNVLNEQNLYSEAIAKYRKTIELNPKHAIAYINWGNVLNEQNLYSEAIAKYQKATELNRKEIVAYYNWGNVLNEQEYFEEAIAKYQRAIELNLQNAKAYYNWGNVLNEQKLYGEAIAKYQKATELNPRDAMAYRNWGVVLIKKNNYDEAIAKYQKATELEPKYARTYYDLGNLLRRQGRDTEAAINIAKYRELTSHQ
jgi:tetratricopeptide (TPR) repeat protein